MESISRISEWIWSKGYYGTDATSRMMFSATENATASWKHGFANGDNHNNYLYQWMSQLPHAASYDYREPLFTFEWNNKEFGFYSLSIMYWAEMLAVRWNS